MDQPLRSGDTRPLPPLGWKDIRTLGLTSLGGGLELFDFVLFVYFVPTIAVVFFPPGLPSWLAELQAFTVFAVGYFARPVGGVVIAHFGDRIGRKRTFTFTLSLMALATLGMAVLPGYGQWGAAAPVLLCLLRITQGFAVGGEVAGGYLFGSEHVPEARRGTALGIVAAGITIGTVLGVLLALAVHLALSPAQIEAFGWRIPFAIGGGLGLVSILLRRALEETPVFRGLRARGELVQGLPIGEVVRGHGGAVLLSVLTFWPFIGHFVILSLMGPTLLQTLDHMAPVPALLAGCLATLGLILTAPLSGQMFDRLGPARALVLVAPLALACDLACFLIGAHLPGLRLPLLLLAGLGGGLLAAASVIMIRAFPPRVAYSGVALSFNIVSGFLAGLTPMLISGLLPWLPSAPLWYLTLVCLIAFAAGLWLLRREAAVRAAAL